MKKMIVFAALLLILTSCTRLKGYRSPLEQGNALNSSQINTVKKGMTKAEVSYYLGKPVLQNTFQDNTWEYIYTFKKMGEKQIEKRLTLVFKHDRLANITNHYN